MAMAASSSMTGSARDVTRRRIERVRNAADDDDDDDDDACADDRHRCGAIVDGDGDGATARGTTANARMVSSAVRCDVQATSAGDLTSNTRAS